MSKIKPPTPEQLAIIDTLHVDIVHGTIRDKDGNELVWQDWAGYIKVSVLGRGFFGHHIVWYKATGKWPTTQLDHENRKKWDNRFENLREATVRQNVLNCERSLTRDLPIGVSIPTNVTPNTKKRYRASIHRNGKSHYLGTYETPEEASAVYQKTLAESEQKNP